MQVETCFREHGDSMTRAMEIFSGDEQAAQDAVQQAFMKALANRAMLEQMPEPAMRAWLHATARNALIDMKRRQSRLVFDVDENFIFDEDDPTDKIVVHSLLSKLPQNLKVPVYMKYFSGMNSTEIGQALNLPSSTVRTRLRSAISMMRDMMEGD